jgi:hypothetical protein
MPAARRLSDLPRNDAQAAFNFWLAERKRTGTISRETGQVLSQLQDDPTEYRQLIEDYWTAVDAKS